MKKREMKNTPKKERRSKQYMKNTTKHADIIECCNKTKRKKTTKQAKSSMIYIWFVTNYFEMHADWLSMLCGKTYTKNIKEGR